MTRFSKLIVVNHYEADNCHDDGLFIPPPTHTNRKKEIRKRLNPAHKTPAPAVCGEGRVGSLTPILESLIAGLIPLPKCWFSRALAIVASLTFRKKKMRMRRRKSNITHLPHWEKYLFWVYLLLNQESLFVYPFPDFVSFGQVKK